MSERSVASAGSVCAEQAWNGVPVAWAAVAGNGQPLCLAYEKRDAEKPLAGMAKVVPLYRQPQPTLTDAEREAINDAIYLCGATAGLADAQANATAWATCAATLRGLRERLGGGK